MFQSLTQNNFLAFKFRAQAVFKLFKIDNTPGFWKFKFYKFYYKVYSPL